MNVPLAVSGARDQGVEVEEQVQSTKHGLSTHYVPSSVTGSKCPITRGGPWDTLLQKAQHGEGKPMAEELGCPGAEVECELGLGEQRGCSNTRSWEGHSRQREQQSKGRGWDVMKDIQRTVDGDEWEIELEWGGGKKPWGALHVLVKFGNVDHQRLRGRGQCV